MPGLVLARNRGSTSLHSVTVHPEQDREATDGLCRLNPCGLLSPVQWTVMEASLLDKCGYPQADHTHRPALGVPSPWLYSFALTVAVLVN